MKQRESTRIEDLVPGHTEIGGLVLCDLAISQEESTTGLDFPASLWYSISRCE
jgi:hypothetical protein